MKPFSLDRSSILLFVIIAFVAGALIFMGVSLRSDEVDEAVKVDRILNVLVVLELEGKPAAAELFLFYPSTGKGAILDVPAETGLIIKSLNRVDRIDALYDPRRPKAYVEEVARVLAAAVPYYLILDAKGLAGTVDLLEGLELFIPQPMESAGPPPVRLPSGALVVDGDKAVQFASYRGEEEGEGEAAARRQKLTQALFRRLGQKASWLAEPTVFPVFQRALRTNLSTDALRRFAQELGRLDADRLVQQRITGVYREVDGKRLLFPHYDGELVRDIVKQTLNALSNSGGADVADKIFTVEILNGTPSKGLAKRTAEIFQSFGYDVVSVGNADREDYASTVVLDRFANAEAAGNVADVIRCKNVSPGGGQGDAAAVADFTVILGNDFNGRYCAK